MVPGVEGSSPFTHPTDNQGLGAIPIPDRFSTQGCSQVVRQGTLTPSSAGSSPAIPAKPFLGALRREKIRSVSSVGRAPAF